MGILLNRLSNLSHSHVHELKAKLFHVTKTSSVYDYLKKIKDLVNRLAATRDIVKDANFVFYTLNDLPREYMLVKFDVRTRGFPIEFTELSSLLEAEEVNISINNALVNQRESTVLSVNCKSSSTS